MLMIHGCYCCYCCLSTVDADGGRAKKDGRVCFLEDLQTLAFPG